MMIKTTAMMTMTMVVVVMVVVMMMIMIIFVSFFVSKISHNLFPPYMEEVMMMMTVFRILLSFESNRFDATLLISPKSLKQNYSWACLIKGCINKNSCKILDIFVSGPDCTTACFRSSWDSPWSWSSIGGAFFTSTSWVTCSLEQVLHSRGTLQTGAGNLSECVW